jgi:predicted metal-binding membrane protein
MPDMMMPAIKSWSPVDFAVMLVMWTVMMVGMMTPSAAPMILIYARVGRQAAERGNPLPATAWFAGGYLLSWLAFSLVATTMQWALIQAALLTPMMAITSGMLGGGVLIVAGLYQLSPWKETCLRHCQNPLIFVQHHGGFRRDIGGSVGLGFRHGLYCIGCCWALMALLFVGGIMNLLWIAALTIFVLAEKAFVRGQWLSRAAGVALLIGGTWLAATQ